MPGCLPSVSSMPRLRSIEFCMSMRPTNIATLPLVMLAAFSASIAACPASLPAATLSVPTNALRCDFGASESCTTTGIFAATRSSSGVIASGLMAQIAMPSKFCTRMSSMKRCCSETSVFIGRNTSALMPRSFSALRTPFSAMFQKSDELLVTNAK